MAYVFNDTFSVNDVDRDGKKFDRGPSLSHSLFGG